MGRVIGIILMLIAAAFMLATCGPTSTVVEAAQSGNTLVMEVVPTSEVEPTDPIAAMIHGAVPLNYNAVEIDEVEGLQGFLNTQGIVEVKPYAISEDVYTVEVSKHGNSDLYLSEYRKQPISKVFVFRQHAYGCAIETLESDDWRCVKFEWPVQASSDEDCPEGYLKLFNHTLVKVTGDECGKSAFNISVVRYNAPPETLAEIE